MACESIGGPVIDYYKLLNSAVYLQKRGHYEEAIARWRQVLELKPDDEMAHNDLGLLLLLTGHRDEAAVHLRRASEIKLRKAAEAPRGETQAPAR